MKYADRTYIMGILNVTPDSFYDGGKYKDADQAIEHALKMIDEGADIIDIGGNSTRPGSEQVSAQEELNRIKPVLLALRKRTKVLISVDTFYSEVAKEAIDIGADIINDVSGLKRDKALADVVAQNNVQIILMHSKGDPKDMQEKPVYDDVIKEIKDSLKESIDIAKNAGIKDANIIVDPGIGFGKTVEHNLMIIKALESFQQLMYPILIGVSRKSFIGQILETQEPKERLLGSLVMNVASVLNGANILRVHDVKEAVEAVMLFAKVNAF
jgi:dihydropteroate synthase